MTQTPIVKGKKFIKVIDQKLAEKLIASGFSYIQEGKFYAFTDTSELISALQQMGFSDKQYYAENKLRF